LFGADYRNRLPRQAIVFYQELFISSDQYQQTYQHHLDVELQQQALAFLRVLGRREQEFWLIVNRGI
jgi:hypothetical protein